MMHVPQKQPTPSVIKTRFIYNLHTTSNDCFMH